MFEKIKLAILAGAAVALAILFWSWWDRGKTIDALNVTIGEQQTTIRETADKLANERAAVKILEAQRATDQKDLLELAAENTEIEKKLSAAVADFNAWRGKLNGEILKRPEVYERASSLATRRVMRDFEALTGGNHGRADGEANDDPAPAPAGDGPGD